jgi:hypothetical protein
MRSFMAGDTDDTSSDGRYDQPEDNLVLWKHVCVPPR